MLHRLKSGAARTRGVACIGILVLGPWLLATGSGPLQRTGTGVDAARRPAGYPQLVSLSPLAEEDGRMCQWDPASSSLAAARPQHQPAATSFTGAGERMREDGERAPVRVIRDTYPTYSAVAVDTNSDEVYLLDENLYGLKVFDRTANAPSTAGFTEPKRTVGGILTKLEFNSALYVDPKNGDVYSVNNDNLDTTVVFPRDARGNVPPMRELNSPHGTFGMTVDEDAQELFFTVQHDNAVVVYGKDAKGDDNPIRLLQGNDTGLEDPHGIAVDSRNRLMFVSNHGSFHAVRRPAEGARTEWRPRPNWPLDRDTAVRGSGRSDPPSITVYSLKAEGNARPLRVIEGPKTRLNWPSTMSIDPERGELFVANDANHAVLVFRTTDAGNVAPSRVIQGDKTGIRYPTGIFVDTKNRELWVSNLGNHSATVYPLNADGNVAPLRTIRSAPRGKEALAIGNPGAVGYDAKRDELLVPN